MSSEAVRVIYRRWRSEGGDLIALFPEIPSDIFGRYCLSYAHIGQHAGADYHGVVAASTPVTPEEAALLARELERIGYQLRVMKRASRKHHEARRAAAKALR